MLMAILAFLSQAFSLINNIFKMEKCLRVFPTRTCSTTDSAGLASYLQNAKIHVVMWTLAPSKGQR